MNERLRELAEQAERAANYLMMQKFAELIVRETIKEMATQMDEFGDDQSNNPVWYKSEKAVKKYFGIEGE